MPFQVEALEPRFLLSTFPTGTGTPPLVDLPPDPEPTVLIRDGAIAAVVSHIETPITVADDGSASLYHLPMAAGTNLLQFQLKPVPGGAPFVADVAVYTDQGLAVTQGPLAIGPGRVTVLDWPTDDPDAQPAEIGVALDLSQILPSPSRPFVADLTVTIATVIAPTGRGAGTLADLTAPWPTGARFAGAAYAGWTTDVVRGRNTGAISSPGTPGPTANPPPATPGPPTIATGPDGGVLSAPSPPAPPPSPIEGRSAGGAGTGPGITVPLPVQSAGDPGTLPRAGRPTAPADTHQPPPVALEARPLADPPPGADDEPPVSWREGAGAPMLGAARAVPRRVVPAAPSPGSVRLASRLLPAGAETSAPAAGADVWTSPTPPDLPIAAPPGPVAAGPPTAGPAPDPAASPKRGGTRAARWGGAMTPEPGGFAAMGMSRRFTPFLAGLGGSTALITGLLMPDLQATLRSVSDAHRRARRRGLRA